MIKVEEILILGGLVLLLLTSWIIRDSIIIRNNIMLPFIGGFAVIFIILGVHLKKINN